MENLEWKSLKLWTSYVSPALLEELVKRNILPVFIARRISNSTLIGNWEGTAVHFPELAPSPELLRSWKYQGMPDTEFRKAFEKELNHIRLGKIFGRMKTMADLTGAIGVAILGYGPNRFEDHRSVVADYINRTGLLENKVTELIL
jgi:uncharacterized protein YeaO (DUF488 family)